MASNLLKRTLSVSFRTFYRSQRHASSVRRSTSSTSRATTVLDGSVCASQFLRPNLLANIDDFTTQFNRKPCLATISVNQNGSDFNEKRKRFANDLGFELLELNFPALVEESQILEAVHKLNNNPEVDGILPQFPFPVHLSASSIYEQIDAMKDIDGLHPMNVGRFARRPQAYISEGIHENQAYEDLHSSIRYVNLPYTPLSVLTLLDTMVPDMCYMTRHAIIIGRNNLVSKPLALMLLARGASVTMAHTTTSNLESLVGQADIVVSGMGTQDVIDGNWVKERAVVVDVNVRRIPGAAPSGIHDESNECSEIANYDVAFQRASAITPLSNVGFEDVVLSVVFGNTLKSGLYRELKSMEEARFS